MKEPIIMGAMIILMMLLSVFTVAQIARSSIISQDMFMEDGRRAYAGKYSPSFEFYCVYLGNKSMEDVQYTDYHEVCHHMVAEDKKHFCGRWKE